MSRRLTVTIEERAASLRIGAAMSTRGLRRKIAIELLGGGDQPQEKIKSKQSQITKWATGQVVPSRESAEQLARAYRRATGEQIADDYFVVKGDGQTSWQDQVREVAEETARATYHGELRKLREELDRVRREEAERHESLLEEIRKLREAI